MNKDNKQQIKKWGNAIVLFLVAFLFIGILHPGAREIFGSTMNIFMSPVILFVGAENFFLVLSVLAIFTATCATLVQKYLIDQSAMAETMERMKAFQKEMKEARETQNTYMLKRLEEQQTEMLQDQMKMIKGQFKPMLYIVLVSLPFFIWAFFYVSSHPEASMYFPFWGEQYLGDRLFVVFTYWIFWYFLSSLAFSQVLRKILNIRTPGM